MKTRLNLRDRDFKSSKRPNYMQLITSFASCVDVPATETPERPTQLTAQCQTRLSAVP